MFVLDGFQLQLCADQALGELCCLALVFCSLLLQFCPRALQLFVRRLQDNTQISHFHPQHCTEVTAITDWFAIWFILVLNQVQHQCTIISWMWQGAEHLNNSKLTIHLSLLIFQLLFQCPDLLLQKLLLFKQGVSLRTENLQLEGIIKPIMRTGIRRPEKLFKHSITNTPPQCDWTSQCLW